MVSNLHNDSVYLFLQVNQTQHLRNFWKISGYTCLALIARLLIIWLLIQTTLFQNFIVSIVATQLSSDLQTTVRIRHVDFELFNTMELQGTLVKDRNKDTLLYAGKVKVNLTDWFFLKDNIGLQYVGLEDASIYMHRRDSIWNYQFIIDYFTPATPSQAKKKNIQLDLKLVELSNVHFFKKDEWRGEDQLIHFRSLAVDARKVDLVNRKVDIKSIAVVDPFFSIYDYPARRTRRPASAPKIRSDSSLRWNPEGWELLVESITMTNGTFKSDKQQERKPYYHFDGLHILFGDITGNFKNLRFYKDTITATVDLSTKERSGFFVKSMKTDMKWHPEGMEFNKLDIRTSKSHLTNYFAMRYDDFSDMSSFIEKVQMEGNFKNSLLDSDDIAFFAPALEKWKKKISISGSAKGTVENLTARNMLILAGKNSILRGNLSMKGLPDINNTYIDFTSNDFRTTYADIVTFVPDVKDITEPRLDRLEYLRFRGNFNGFVKDFVAAGVIETGLGTIVTDLNMKFPEKGNASYSGKVSTSSFNIGSFIDHENVGNISFNGNIKGSSLDFKTLQATLDGKVNSIEFNKYTYQDITVKGTVAKRLFNGTLKANDPNLVAQLDGLVDLSKTVPLFNFTAAVEKAALQPMRFSKEPIDFTGQFLFNFSGDNIDNFLGQAKVYDASIYRGGQRISFDSLNVESKMIDNSKSIIVLSNELEAAIVGEFSIMELPNAFQTFLNRYYPTYIKPSTQKLENENFSFVITTKKIDDYMDLVDKNLKGFNNSTFTGRINSKEGLFDVNAEVPQFNYKNISFYDVKLEGRGNLDTLSMTSRLGDVYINDSLHFPGTIINVQSAQDLSKVSITTSANQTLNSANVSAQVQTLRNGVRIQFNPSTFDINGKTWTIDKNGDLVLSKELITTEGLRIYNGDQEVYVTSQPSDTGNSNDLKIDLKKINIGDFTPYVVKQNRLEGLLNGTVEIADPFGNMTVDVNAEAEQFRLDDDSIGKIRLTSNYSARTGKVNFKGISENENYNFDLEGVVNTLDSSTSKRIDMLTNFQNTNIHVLEKYLSGTFGRLTGKASGQLRITGPLNDLDYLGKVNLVDGGMEVKYTRCYYKIPAATFQFNEGFIDFGTFGIKDTLNNAGEVLNGKLYHEGFRDLAFDFRLKSNKLLLLNTGPTDSKQFFGKVIGKVNMSFTGPLEDMVMDIKGEPTDSSVISLPIGSSRESDDADFIVWKVYGKEMQPPPAVGQESNLSVKLQVNANPLVNVRVILDELTGDVISANGTGNIDLRVGTRENMTMSGRYNIIKGDYTFTFQSIKRNFTLKPDANNFISWNGDPYQATINLDAVYRAENVRFSDLLSGTTQLTSNEDVKRYRGPVLVVANISGRLTAPELKFKIELPDDSRIKNNPDVVNIFQNFLQKDENELNKQVSLLILINSFAPYGGGTRAGSNIASGAFQGILVNSISGFLSNVLTKEFSSALQNIFKDPSLKVNINATLYNGTNLVDIENRNAIPDRTSFNFSINKSFFNERLTFIVGSAFDFGLSAQQTNLRSRNFQFLPDLTAEWKLTPDGKFRLSFFYRDNYSYATGNPIRQNRAGGGISFRKDFERLEDFFKSKKKEKPKKDTSTTVTATAGSY